MRFTRLVPLALAAALALASTAHAESALQRAREAHLGSRALPTHVALNGALVELSRAEWVVGQRPLIRLTNTGAGAIAVHLPALFTKTAASGLRYTSATARVSTLRPGHSVAFRDLGLPARPYALAISRRGTTLGAVRVRVFAPERDGDQAKQPAWAKLRAPLPDTNASNDFDEE